MAGGTILHLLCGPKHERTAHSHSVAASLCDIVYLLGQSGIWHASCVSVLQTYELQHSIAVRQWAVLGSVRHPIPVLAYEWQVLAIVTVPQAFLSCCPSKL